MDNDLVTVATYSTIAQAHVVKSELEGAGIRVRLADEEMVGMLWHFGNAIGGVKVLVARSDLERSCEIIRRIFQEDETPLTEEELTAQALAMSREDVEDVEDVDDAKDSVEKEQPTAEEKPVEEPAPVENDREQCARKLFFVAWLGLVFFPFMFYAFYLLFQILLRSEPLSSRRRFDAIAGGILMFPALFVAFVICGQTITGFLNLISFIWN